MFPTRYAYEFVRDHRRTEKTPEDTEVLRSIPSAQDISTKGGVLGDEALGCASVVVEDLKEPPREHIEALVLKANAGLRSITGRDEVLRHEVDPIVVQDRQRSAVALPAHVLDRGIRLYSLVR